MTATRKRGRPPVIPDERIRDILSSYGRGLPVAMIARVYGVARRTVRDVVDGVIRLEAVPIPGLPPEAQTAIEAEDSELLELLRLFALQDLKLARGGQP